MSSTAIFWIVYVIGYFVWFGYATNRFITPDDRNVGDALCHAILALAWPGCLPAYMAYRICLWIGVRYS